LYLGKLRNLGPDSLQERSCVCSLIGLHSAVEKACGMPS
jgi:hypothetical protein